MALPSNFKRIRGGFIAKKRGEAFENAITNQCRRYGIEVIDIPDGCEQKSAHVLIRVPTPFDYVLLWKGKAVFLDAKTQDDKTFPYSKIKPDQLAHLSRCAGTGFRAGYLIYLRAPDRVCFFGTTVLQSLKPRESLVSSMGLDLGSIADFDVRLLFDAP